MIRVISLFAFFFVSQASAQVSDDTVSKYKSCMGENKAYTESAINFIVLERACRELKMTGNPEKDKSLIEPLANRTMQEMEVADKTKSSYSESMPVDKSWNQSVLEAKLRNCQDQGLDIYFAYAKDRDAVPSCFDEKGVEALNQAAKTHPEMKLVMERASCVAGLQTKKDMIANYKIQLSSCSTGTGPEARLAATILSADFKQQSAKWAAALKQIEMKKILSLAGETTPAALEKYPGEIAQCKKDEIDLNQQLAQLKIKLNSCFGNKPVSTSRVNQNPHKMGRSSSTGTSPTKASGDAPKATN